MTLLQIDQLGFAHPEAPPLFSAWSATLPAGVSLLEGDTGSGKTTLLRILAGALPATGSLVLAGRSLALEPMAYRQQVGFLDHEREAPPAPGDTIERWLSAVSEQLPGLDLKTWHQHADAFGLGPHLHKPLVALSTGSRRKLWLAAVFSCDCALCLLDEPAAALDPPAVGYLMACLAEQARRRDRATLVVAGAGLPGVTLAGRITLPAGP